MQWDLSTWANVAEIIGALLAVSGTVGTILKVIKARKRSAAIPLLRSDQVLMKRVSKILLERLRERRKTGARDVLWITLAVAEGTGVLIPRSLALIRPTLISILERTMLATEQASDMSKSTKEQITKVLGYLIIDIDKWNVLPPGSIREWSIGNWFIFLGVGGIFCWLSILAKPPLSLLWAIGGIVFYVYIDMEEYLLAKRTTRNLKDLKLLNTRLINATQISDVVNVNDGLEISFLLD